MCVFTDDVISPLAFYRLWRLIYYFELKRCEFMPTEKCTFEVEGLKLEVCSKFFFIKRPNDARATAAGKTRNTEIRNSKADTASLRTKRNESEQRTSLNVVVISVFCFSIDFWMSASKYLLWETIPIASKQIDELTKPGTYELNLKHLIDYTMITASSITHTHTHTHTLMQLTNTYIFYCFKRRTIFFSSVNEIILQNIWNGNNFFFLHFLWFTSQYCLSSGDEELLYCYFLSNFFFYFSQYVLWPSSVACYNPAIFEHSLIFILPFLQQPLYTDPSIKPVDIARNSRIISIKILHMSTSISCSPEHIMFLGN